MKFVLNDTPRSNDPLLKPKKIRFARSSKMAEGQGQGPSRLFRQTIMSDRNYLITEITNFGHVMEIFMHSHPSVSIKLMLRHLKNATTSWLKVVSWKYPCFTWVNRSCKKLHSLIRKQAFLSHAPMYPRILLGLFSVRKPIKLLLSFHKKCHRGNSWQGRHPG